MKPIPRSKLVYLNVQAATAAGATVRFPDISELRTAFITGIEFYDRTMLAATPDQQPVILAADAVGAVLVLKEHSTERVQEIPLTTLLPLLTAGIWKELIPFVVNWQASYVRFTALPAQTAFTIPFSIFYLAEKEYRRAA